MDDFLRRQRQNDRPMRRTLNTGHQQPGQGASQQRRTQHTGSIAGDRQRKTTDGGQAMSVNGSSGSYNGYYQQPTTSVFPPGSGALPNTLEYGQSAAGYSQDTRHPQNFGGAYSPTSAGVMYNVPQGGPQSSVFDIDRSFSARQPGAMQMIPAGVASASYFPSNSLAAAATVIQSQAAPTGYLGTMGAILAGSLPSNRTAGSASDQSAPTSAAMATQDYADTNEAYASYQRTLKEVVENVRSGALETASGQLLQISDWLLSNVELLGLTLDDGELYESRIMLWKNLNNAWLGLLEKQKKFILSGVQLQRSQSLISLDKLQKMGRELTRLCDSVERFGLVDYDYGIWEERIMDGLTECVQLYNQEEV